MFKIPLGTFDGERAAKKNLKFVIQGQFAKIVKPTGSTVSDLAKSLGCSESDLTALPQQEVDSLHQILLQERKKVDDKVVKTEEKAKKANASSKMGDEKGPSQYKLNFKCPVLKLKTPEQVEETADALLLAKQLKVCEDKNLIFQSICESNRYDLFKSLDEAQKTDLTAFIKFLRLCFGNDEHGLRQLRRFDDLKQQVEENEICFFQRVINTFYNSRNKERPATIPQDDRLLIRKKFVEGISNEQVKAAVVSNLTSIEFDKLGAQAKSYREAYEVLQAGKQLSVLAIEPDDRSPRSGDDNSVKGRNRERSFSRGRSDRHRSWSRDRRSNQRRYDDRSRDRDSSRGHYRRSRFDRSSSRDHYRSHGGDKYRQRKEDRYRSSSRDTDDSASDQSPDRRVSWSDQQRGLCFRCGQNGHYRRECQASAKTVMQYRKRLDRSHDRRRGDRY